MIYHTEKGNLYRQKMSERVKGENNPMYGKTHSEEERQKRSRNYSGEGNPMYGKTHSKEAREAMSKARKGKPSGRKGMTTSDEHKQSIRKTYIVNDTEVVTNAKAYCEENGYQYANFLKAASSGKPYRGLHIRKVDD